MASPPVLPHLPTTSSSRISPLSLYPHRFLFWILTFYYLRLRSLLIHGRRHAALPLVRLDFQFPFTALTLPFVSLFTLWRSFVSRFRGHRPRTV